MNRLAAIACLGLGLAASPVLNHLLSTPVADAGPANVKVGVIDLERTLYETPAGKKASDAFDKTRKAKQDELDKKQKDLQKAAADLDKQAAVLKPDVLKTKRDALEKKFVDVQQLYVKLERDLATERTKLIQDLLKKASPIVQDIAKTEGVHIIVDQSAVVWADPSVDLTAKLNAKMK
jgi:outer membrane protein